MKLSLIIGLFLALASPCFEQTPSASPTPTPAASSEKRRARTFGSSLRKYKPKELRDFQDRPKSNGSDEVETIGVTTDLVVNDVLVKDQNGKMVTELNKDDFVVTEDGAPQKIEVFSRGENASVPRSIVLIINSCTPNVPYLKKSIAAAKTLVDELSPQDKMAIVTVDVRLLVDFTENKTLLKKTLDSVEKRSLERRVIPGLGHYLPIFPGCGGSREFEALLATLNEMFEEKNRQPIIIFQGEATEVMWLKPDKDAPYPIYDSIREISEISGWSSWKKVRPVSHLGFSDVKEAIERSRATIYSVATGIQFLGFSKKERMARGGIAVERLWRAVGWKFDPRDRDAEVVKELFTEVLTAAQTAMLRIAELSGGNLGFIEKPEDAETVYSTIFKLISNRYLIGYYPTNQVRDGKRREIKVEVRNHPEYVVTGRKAYFPQ